MPQRSLSRLRGRDREGAGKCESATMVDVLRAPAWQVSTKQRTRARRLRRDLTDAERIIWNAIRAHRLHGMSFRRQTPIGPFIVDFVCHTAWLIIEIDDGQHYEAENTKRDAQRDAFLGSKGYRILRFNNHEVMTNRHGVLQTIATAIVHAPSPPLPRKRGREQAVPVTWPGPIES
jgi:very-short-patch-repair endonuclease